ncbi:hypothetical protein BDW02DRAFT_314976 [Decorospora gaudefroyi]|uniref:SAP domain-containing protein n=1 Tax=Decorospora gaudefroyi TaxID=184978 RepID=A0A6A5KKI4_9PLEO|nr:hypothetical protein BDW02DRAFT_314976 [Decorospora gaudefroyi]
MTDYSKQTVAQLRQLLKDRSIPSTGLTRKAQIIEKLQEADRAGAEASNASETGTESADAPPDPVKQVEEEVVPGPALAEAGEPEAQLTRENEPAPQVVPAATSDPIPETISHIDSELPPPDSIKAIEQSAEETTNAEEPGSIQPAGVFNAPPADPDDVIGPTVTEPADAEVKGEEKEDVAKDELPDAPGPAAEALRLAQKSDLPEVLQDTTEEKTASPAPDEKQSVEKVDLLTVPEQSTAETSRLPTEELEADSKKRKRRSGTPEMGVQDIKAKKHRPSQEPAPEVHLKEDEDVVMEQRRPQEETEVAIGVNQEDTDGDHAAPVDAESPATEADTKREKKEKTARYKDLVKSSADDTPQEALTDDRPTVPALHPVTSALYIRNFMRPLRPEPLRAHLISLASPSAGSPDSTIVQALFLDAMKTHALVRLSTKTAASRVRAALHGSIWPPEGNRKELWVDFIPEQSVDPWIKEEENAITAEKEARANGHSTQPKRFEVIYPEAATDGTITAVFQEVGSSAPANAPRGPRASVDVRPPPSTHPLPPPSQDIEASFKTLDQLFSSTDAKPQLFFLPVSDEVSDIRLKELDAETSRNWSPGETRKGRGIKVEMKYKYSFDGEHRLVEVAEDRGPWSDGYRGGRGGFRGGGRGRAGAGGYRGRGDVWRG